MTLKQEEKERLLLLRDDFEYYATNMLKITTKGGGQLVPFQLNRAQKYVHKIIEKQWKEFGRVRVLLLKGRQQGMSTYVEARFFWRVVHNFGMNAFILTHQQKATDNLYNMVDRYYHNLPFHFKPHISKRNANELYFDKLQSGYKVGTAGNKGEGRSATIHLLHGSEVAWWANAEEHAAGIFQAISNSENTEIILETTANGMPNYFHSLWQASVKGETDFIPIFVPWFWQEEYRETVSADFFLTEEEIAYNDVYKLHVEQLAWRRKKIAEFNASGMNGHDKFKQEYPSNPTEAFLSSAENTLIPPLAVSKAQSPNYANLERVGAKILGVDPAVSHDRTAFIRRQGRVAYNLEVFRKIDTMQIAGLIYERHKNEKFDYICVDSIGIGMGVYDRLKELLGSEAQHVLKGINAGETKTVMFPSKYLNKRAEMWGRMHEWLTSPNLDVSLPNSDELLQDLCGQEYKHNSLSQLQLISKKESNLPSPDTADALALTFAISDEQVHKKHDTIEQLLNYSQMYG